jgi:cell wall-associated NlpC family hydrolase
MSGSTNPAVEGLLTSGSPTQVLERAALLDAAGDHRSNVVDQVTVVRTQADAAAGAAEQAVAKAATLKQQAASALAHAEQLEASARQEAQAVQAQQVTLQAQLQQAQQTLVSLKGQRAAYEIYQQQQSAAAAKAAAAAARSATVPTPKRSTAPVQAPVTSAGRADGSAVETAIRAAERWIGTIYAWGGGSTTGPSEGWGIDKGVVGFDCSGLTRYAYAQAGISIPRQSTAQYAALPKVSRSDLQRGDLVFWATDTSDPSTVHHVAVYLGNGQILEAPQSGLSVRVTAMRWAGYIGATRPSA